MTFSTQPASLSQVLADRADSERSVTFVNGQKERKRCAYSEMYQRAALRLSALQTMNIEPGQQMIIQCSNNELFVEAFWACLLGGIVPVPVSGGNSSEQRQKLFRIAEKLDNPALFSEQRTIDRLAEFSARTDQLEAFDQLRSRTQIADDELLVGNNPQLHKALGDDVAFIQFSSGSTSTPKGIVLTHNNLIVNMRSIIDGCLMNDADHLLSWMPLTHDMGLIGFHLTPLMCNVDHSLIPTDVFVRRPSLWLSESARAGASILCSPNFGYQHLLKTFKADKQADLDLSCVRLLFNGAEPISVSLCEQFMATLKPFGLPPDAMFPVYGLAEASLAVSFPPLSNRFTSLCLDRQSLSPGEPIAISRDPAQGVRFVAVGEPVSNVQISIRSEHGVELAEGHTGHICIHGENVTQGYYKEPVLNAELIDPAGWLDTGDLGFVHEGLLYITGRAKDIIFASGQNIYPHDLEEIIINAGLVERGKIAIGAVAAQDQQEEQLLVFVLHRSDASELTETAQAITRILSTEAGVSVHAVVPVSAIPKTTSGKVQRYLLLTGFQQGEYAPLVQSQYVELPETDAADTAPAEDAASQSSTEVQLLGLCKAQIEDRQLDVNDNLFELGISSLTLAQIHAAIEETWPDRVEITDLFDYPTVAELAAFLDQSS